MQSVSFQIGFEITLIYKKKNLKKFRTDLLTPAVVNQLYGSLF